MNAKLSVIERALPIVCSVYAEKFGVSIEIGGDDAYTKGGYIRLPAIDPEYVHPDSLYGFLAHEAAHVRWTDFNTYSNPSFSEFKRDLLNVLEDGRIEEMMVREFKGTGATLDRALEYYVNSGLIVPLSEDADEASVFFGYILRWMRARWRKQAFLDDQLKGAETLFQKHFPQGVYTRLQALLRQAPLTQSTAEAADLTQRILEMLKDEKEKAEQQSKNESQQGGDQGQDGDQDQNQNGSQGQKGDDQKGDGQGGKSGSKDKSKDKDGAGNGGDQKPKDKSEEKSGSDNQGDDSSKDSDQGKDKNAGKDSGQQTEKESKGEGGAGAGEAKKHAEALQKVIAAEGEREKDVFDAIAKKLSEDAKRSDLAALPGMTTPRPKLSPRGHDFQKDVVKEAKANSSGLRQVLNRVVQSRKRAETRLKNYGRRITADRLVRTAQGDMRVFRHRKEEQRVNTAVHILCDRSGSMSSSMKVANQATMALALALDAMPGVRTAVTYFGETLSPNPVVDFGDRVNAYLPNIASQYASGGTPLGPALWHAAKQFVTKCDEPRRIVIVVTDGQPVNPAGCRKLMDMMEKSGVSIFGIGIGPRAHSFMPELFTDHQVINNIKELKSALFNYAQRAL